MKNCNTCGTTKELSDFHKDRNREDGLTSQCKACRGIKGKARYQANKDRLLAQKSEWRAANRDRILAQKKAYREANKERLSADNKAYRQAHPDKVNARVAKRKARKLKATPVWLTAEQNAEINALYTEAKKLEMITGDKYHVDHIVPLQGKNVSGLHVPWNLQLLTEEENLQKSNSYTE